MPYTTPDVAPVSPSTGYTRKVRGAAPSLNTMTWSLNEPARGSVWMKYARVAGTAASK